jgi:hypothetical protein
VCKLITKDIKVVLMTRCFIFTDGWDKKYMCESCAEKMMAKKVKK